MKNDEDPDAPLNLYLIRHGNMAGDPHLHFVPPVRSGCLSPQGEGQAERLAEGLQDLLLTHVYASPLGRALQTAQGLADPRGLEVGVVPWLEEWRPAHVMAGLDPAGFESLMARAAVLRPEQTWKTEAGESLCQMADRIVPGFQRLLADHGIEAGHGGWLRSETRPLHLALVGHGGSLNVLLTYLLGLPMQPGFRFAFAETGMAALRFERRVDVWYPVLHLPPGRM